jgi:hypothetical protein
MKPPWPSEINPAVMGTYRLKAIRMLMQKKIATEPQ